MSNTQMGRARIDPDHDIRHLRKEILLYCHDLPELLRQEGGAATADMALTLGKCFIWIEAIFSRYDRELWTMDHHTDKTVGGIGEELWVLGLELDKRRGHESETELRFARMNLRLRTVEQMVLRMGGPAT